MVPGDEPAPECRDRCTGQDRKQQRVAKAAMPRRMSVGNAEVESKTSAPGSNARVLPATKRENVGRRLKNAARAKAAAGWVNAVGISPGSLYTQTEPRVQSDPTKGN